MITTISIKTKKIALLSMVALTLSLGSCSDILDVEPQDKLSGDQVYRNVYDADAAVIGIYGKFMALAEKNVILNEMRADLMTTTRNSSPYLKELSEHNVSADNPYANPKEYYVVIQNCNDALKNFDIMLAEKKFKQDEYNQRYSDVGAIRSWIYLQLGIQYGTVPYVTEPIKSLEDIKDRSKHPRISFDQLLDKLVLFTEDLPYKNPYASGSSLLVSIDGYSTSKFFINKECLLGDLQLWKGNYNEAAKHYKTVMETSTPSGSDSERFDINRISYIDTSNNLSVFYLVNQDTNTLVNLDTSGWRSMFARNRDSAWNTEWIWALPFDNNFVPKNPFIALFSKQNGQYLAKPSQSAIDLWNNQTQKNNVPYDARGPKFTYKMISGEPVIMKYLYRSESAPAGLVENTKGEWYLYRAAKLHLRYAEAANRDHQYRIADAILNYGIKSAYSPVGFDSEKDDATNVQQTKQPFPYDFDARQGQTPYFRKNWHRGVGIRGRAYLNRSNVVGDSLIAIENNIIDEDALELAYEGNRWEDLVRVSMHRNDPAFLANKVYAKLNREGNPKAAEIQAKLMSVNNWYLPFNW